MILKVRNGFVYDENGVIVMIMADYLPDEVQEQVERTVEFGSEAAPAVEQFIKELRFVQTSLCRQKARGNSKQIQVNFFPNFKIKLSMYTFSVLYERDDTTTGTWLCDANSLEDCIQKFETEVGSWSRHMIYEKSPQIKEALYWWGYKHINGTYQVKRYWGKDSDAAIQYAFESSFVDIVQTEFQADNRDDALVRIKQLIP